LAPEVINGQAYDHKIDTWSFGVILYNLLTGEQHIKPTSPGRASIQKLLIDYKPDLKPLHKRLVTA